MAIDTQFSWNEVFFFLCFATKLRNGTGRRRRQMEGELRRLASLVEQSEQQLAADRVEHARRLADERGRVEAKSVARLFFSIFLPLFYFPHKKRFCGGFRLIFL